MYIYIVLPAYVCSKPQAGFIQVIIEILIFLFSLAYTKLATYCHLELVHIYLRQRSSKEVMLSPVSVWLFAGLLKSYGCIYETCTKDLL